MTVKELIDELKEFPEDEHVYMDLEGVHISIEGVQRDGMKAVTIY